MLSTAVGKTGVRFSSEGGCCLQPEAAPAGFLPHDERSYGIAAVKFLEWTGQR